MIENERPVTAVQRVGGALQRVPPAYRAATLALQILGRLLRPRLVNRYLSEVSPDRRRLLIGSGAMTLDGWLSTDLVPVRPSILYLDATKRWPMPAQSFRYIACEHMIEHVSYAAGLGVLAEAHRILRPGGVLRISTPNLDVLRRIPESDDPEVREYVRWGNSRFGSPAERTDVTNPAHALNRIMRAFGHTYIYDEATLRHALTQAGFDQIVRCNPSESAHADLVGVDRHAQLIGAAANRVESMILEATA